MKKALKELIENAPVKRTGKFVELMFIPNGRYYGFYGNNGFSKMIVLGKAEIKDRLEWCKIVKEDDECDLFNIYNQMNKI